jgi:hypothetical protein
MQAQRVFVVAYWPILVTQKLSLLFIYFPFEVQRYVH